MEWDWEADLEKPSTETRFCPVEPKGRKSVGTSRGQNFLGNRTIQSSQPRTTENIEEHKEEKNNKEKNVLQNNDRSTDNWGTLKDSILQIIFSHYANMQLRLVCKNWKRVFDVQYNIKIEAINTKPGLVKRSDSVWSSVNSAATASPRRMPKIVLGPRAAPSDSKNENESLSARKEVKSNEHKPAITAAMLSKSPKSMTTIISDLMKEPQFMEKFNNYLQSTIKQTIQANSTCIKSQLNSQVIEFNELLTNYYFSKSEDDNNMEDNEAALIGNELKMNVITKIFSRIFPDQKEWITWEQLDNDGKVFGWAENVNLYLIKYTNNREFFADIIILLNKSQYSIFLKKLAFYKQKTGKAIKKGVIITSMISDDGVKELIEQNDDISVKLLY